jgi:hypothetical protein
MYLNNGNLKASTVYQFAQFYINPGDSSAVTFSVKWFIDITVSRRFVFKF